MNGTLSPRPARPRAIDRGIPMKLAIGEPAARVIAPHVEVRLNGTAQARVLAYDVPRGEVTVHLADASGRLLRDARKGGPIRTTLKGKVEVRWKPVPR